MADTTSIENPFHINKLLDYLPIIILSVIILVGFFTWEVVRNEMASFMMMILVVIYALWVLKGDAKSYRSWLGTNPDDTYIFPPIPAGQNPFEGSISLFGLVDIPKLGGLIVGILGMAALGLGLGFGSIGIANTNVNINATINTLNTFGGIFSIGGIILLLYSLWKIFREDEPQNGDDNSSAKRTGLGGFIGSVLGFYMIARANIIGNERKEIVAGSDKEKEYDSNPANNGASTALMSGLVIQVVAYAIIVGGLYSFDKFKYDSGVFAWVIKGILSLTFILCGVLWIGTSQRWAGLKSETDVVGDFNSNVFAAHGGIYIIFAVIFLVLTVGGLKKSTTYYSFGWVLVVLFLGCYSWNIAEMALQKNKEITPEQAQMLREEVVKELKSKAPAGSEVAELAINNAVVERIQSKKKPSEIINAVFTTLSAVIMLVIIIFRNTRLRLGICGGFPIDGSWTSIFKYYLTPPDTTAGVGQPGYCDQLNGGDNVNNQAQNTKAFKKIKEGDADNITGAEWDALLNTNSQNIDKTVIRTAKGAMWTPFLLVIMIVSWISIIFARISNSDATNVWIAHSFSGEMFPKVKELIDTFFIVLIVGLLLCGILLLPIVKELNVGGLDTILRVVESIQVWQYDSDNNTSLGVMKGILVFILFLTIGAIGLSWFWDYLRNKDATMPNVPNGWGWAIALVVLFAVCSVPGLYFLVAGHPLNSAFANESFIIRIIRLFFTAVYLVPWLFITVFKLALFGIPGIFSDTMRDKRDEEYDKLKFWKWKAADTDLQLFSVGGKIDPKSVTSMSDPDYSEDAKTKIITAATSAAAGSAAAIDKATMDEALENTPETRDQTKVGAIGKLIKVVLLTVSFVILILSIVYMTYKVSSDNRSAEQAVESGGIAAQMNSPTAHVIYVIMAIVAVAGFVAYIREKFTKANSKTPEDYLFDDYKPEDTRSPTRQLTFGMTHVIYIVLMLIVWVYDTDIDDKNRMSVTGMTVLGIAILFFHYFLELLDNKEPAKPGAAAGADPGMAPMTNLLTNIRFIMNTVFFIVLCVLAYYKQHSVMVVLIVFMFLFHLTKSVIGLKLLRLIWSCIIYIPCLFLGLLTSSQGAVGDTTRPIWIILAIEIILIAILYGGPFLLNYIGASNSQIIAAPVPLRPKNDTGLTTQSPQIFIFHNTALNRSADDSAANCPPEEKKRYNYSVSGWFWLNNNVTAKDKDLEIFNFGGIPKLTYNPSTTEFKVSCKTVELSTGMPTPDASASIIYNSRFNYRNTLGLSSTEKGKFEILNDLQMDTQLPIQKWNYFVINYDGKTMDVFLNNMLVAKSDFIVPDIAMRPITSGDDGGTPAKPDGLSGNICNVAFHKEPMTLEQIRWAYNMLRSQDPPMVGMKTIADEVKTTGTTNMYSR